MFSTCLKASALHLLVGVALFSMASCGGSGGGGSGSDAAQGQAQTAVGQSQAQTTVGQTQTGTHLVSGVAATGAPLYGAVTLKDKNGSQLGPISTDTDGSFTFDTTGLTPPFILKAEWVSNTASYTLFSVAQGAGEANINPFSNLALFLAAGSDPSTIFGSQGTSPDTSKLGASSLSAAMTTIQTVLAPLLAKYNINNFNPISGSYVADPTNPLDTMLDLIGVQVDGNGLITITNATDGTVLAMGNLSDIAGMQVDMTKSPDNQVMTDIQDITARLAALCAVMNLGSALTIGDVDGFFITNPDYGTSNGETRTQDIASIVAIFGPNGSNTNGALASIRNVRLVQDLSGDYAVATRAYLLNYDFIFQNGVIVHGSNVTFGKETSTGLWKFIGDPAGGSGGDNAGLILTGGCVGEGNFGVSGSLYTASGTSTTWGLPAGLVYNTDGSITINSFDSLTLTPSGSPTINADGSYVFTNCSNIAITNMGSTSSSFHANSAGSLAVSPTASPTVNSDGSYTFTKCGVIVLNNLG